MTFNELDEVDDPEVARLLSRLTKRSKEIKQLRARIMYICSSVGITNMEREACHCTLCWTNGCPCLYCIEISCNRGCLN